MKKVTMAMLAHVDAGKTTLSEAMLYHTGVIKKIGRVDKQDAYLDFDDIERNRGITVFSKETVMSYKDTSFTFLDTPGHIDFSCEMERTLQVLDYAILLISARDGVQAHTKTIWNLLKYYNIPTFIFVNKMDLSYDSLDQIVENIQKELDGNCYLINENFNENISLCNDEILEKYLESNIQKEDIIQLIDNRQVFPIVSGSALKDEGIINLLEILNTYTKEMDYFEETSGIVFKKITDQNKTYTFMKITGGSLSVKNMIGDCKIDEMRIYSGKNFTSVKEAHAGDIVACQGLDNLPIGYTFGQHSSKISTMLKPFLTYQITLPEDIEQQKAITQIMKLSLEDPSLDIQYHSDINELSVKVMGDIQLEILKNMIQQRYGYCIEFCKGHIAYMETIENTVEGVGHFEPLRHYSEVHILLEPLPRGSGIIIENKCPNDTLSTNFQRLILTHMQEIEHIGVLTGSVITDIKMTLLAGKAHVKHTEGGDFREATYRAIRNGLKKAKSILLEPYYQFEITVDDQYLSSVIYDLDLFQAKYTIETENQTKIKGKAPVRYLLDYQSEFLSRTKGTGKLFYSLSGYQECLEQDKIIEEIGYDSESDVLHPTGSIFCKHGSGYYVKYDDVENHMHIPYIYEKKVRPVIQKASQPVNEKELEEIFVRTYGPVKRRLSKDMNRTIEKVHEQNVTILPECLLVDGYNIIFSMDKLNKLARENLDHAREMLIDMMCNYQGYRKCLLILVFDAYKVKGNVGSIEKKDNIYIVYTKEAQTADNYIERVTHDLTQDYLVYVATSDALEQTIVSSKGAMRISAREFEMMIDYTQDQGINEFNRKNKQMKNYLLEDIKQGKNND